MSNLTTEQMVIATSTFQESFQHVLGNYVGDSRTHIQKFVAGVVLRQKPYMLVTEEGVQHAMKLAFGNEADRDFLFTLTYTFFSRFGETNEPVKGLATALARGVSIGSHNELSAVPEPLQKRLPVEVDVRAMLESNQWLMTLLMMQLCIQVVVEK